MPSYTVTDPQSGKTVTLTGDSPPTEQELEQIFASIGGDTQQPTPSAAASDVPLVAGMQGYDEQQAAEKAAYDRYNQANPEPSGLQKGLAGVKAAGVMIGNAIPATLGAAVGSAYGALSGQGESAMTQGAAMMSPFSTNDPLANQYMEKAGGVLGQLDPALAVQGQAASMMAKPAVAQLGKSIADNPIVRGTTAAAADAGVQLKNTGGQAISAARDLIPYDPKTVETIQKIREGATENDLAPVELKVVDRSKVDDQGALLPAAFKIVDDPQAIKAIDQGFLNGEVSLMKGLNSKDASLAKAMVETSEKGKNDHAFMADNHPSDVLGGEILADYKHVEAKNKLAGQAIDKEARTNLKGKPVDISKPMDEFIDDLQDKLGVEIQVGENGKMEPVFNRSQIRLSSDKLDRQYIKNIIDDLSNAGEPDAYNVHVFKRAIDNRVVYGDSSSTLKPAVESAVKKLRSGLNEVLQNNFESYKVANKDYSSTIEALGDLRQAAGKKLKFNDVGADKQLGTLSRRLLGEAQSRQEVTNAFNKLRSTAKQFGREADYNPQKLAMIANTLDRRFGSHTPRSFGGEIEKSTAGTGAASQLAEKAARGGLTVVDLGVAGAKYGYEKYKGINNANAYKSLKELLEKQRKKAEQAEKEAAQAGK